MGSDCFYIVKYYNIFAVRAWTTYVLRLCSLGKYLCDINKFLDPLHMMGLILISCTSIMTSPYLVVIS